MANRCFSILDAEKLLWRRALLLACCLVVSACAPALPIVEPEGVVNDSLQRAENAAAIAESFALKTQTQVEKSEKLLAEAHLLLRQAEEAEKRCEALVKSIPKKPKRIRRRKVRKPDPKKELEKKNDPEYSPSDAP